MACVLCGNQMAENGENVFMRVNECNIGEKWIIEWELNENDIICDMCVGCSDECRENEGCSNCSLGCVSAEDFRRWEADAHAFHQRAEQDDGYESN